MVPFGRGGFKSFQELAGHSRQKSMASYAQGLSYDSTSTYRRRPPCRVSPTSFNAKTLESCPLELDREKRTTMVAMELESRIQEIVPRGRYRRFPTAFRRSDSRPTTTYRTVVYSGFHMAGAALQVIHVRSLRATSLAPYQFLSALARCRGHEGRLEEGVAPVGVEALPRRVGRTCGMGAPW